MCGTSCCGSASQAPSRVNLSIVQSLDDAARNHRAKTLENPKARVSLLSSGATPALEIISTDPKDMSSVLVFQKLGAFGALDLKLTTFEITPPKARVVLAFSYDPFGGGAFKVKGTVTIQCDDISNPLGCNVEVKLDGTKDDIQLLINWPCIKACAPQCLYCGTDWQCWLACAGMCIIQCL